MLLVVSYSSCYSETTYGVTNNAAGAGLSWGMDTVLPDASAPWVTLQLNGLTYRYTMNKDAEDDAQVHVRNHDPINGGYVFSETDNWDQQPGATIQKYFSLPYTNSAQWGDGEIVVDGDGSITDPVVIYSYRMDVDDQLMKCATSPLADPSCPGFSDALAQHLKASQLTADDPFYDEWVQVQLNQETELEEEKQQEEKPQEEDLEVQMGGKNSISDLVDTKQQDEILAALASVPTIEPYYTVEIRGGEYQETLTLEDKDLPDNRRAMRSLSSDARHNTMVRSQYDREQ